MQIEITANRLSSLNSIIPFFFISLFVSIKFLLDNKNHECKFIRCKYKNPLLNQYNHVYSCAVICLSHSAIYTALCLFVSF